MSLILDALRQADKDRKTENSAPALDDIYVEERPRKRSLTPIIIVALILCIVIIFVSYRTLFLGANTNTDAEPSVKAGQSSTAENQTTNIAPSENNVTDSNEQLDNETTTQASSISASNLKKRLVEAQYRNVNKATPANTEEEVATQVTELYAKRSNQETSKVSLEKTTPKTSIETSRQSKLSNTNTAIAEDSLLAYSTIPLIKELPLSFQDTIPTLMYSQHTYEKFGSNFIVLNGKNIKEGDGISGGITISEILSDGIVLEKENTLFKMPARSSWINF